MSTSASAPPPQPEVPRPWRSAAFIFIFITILLDMLALGTIIPVLPKLVVTFEGGNTASAAVIYGVFGTAWALMQFFFSPLLGSLSDRVGRRPVILISNFGLGLDYVLMAVAPSLWWLFVGRVISGITAASISTAFAYIADITPAEKRAQRFGLLGVAFGVGFVLGPALGGVAGGFDPRLPFWIAAGLSLANATYGLFILPESLPHDRRTAFSWRQANPFGALALLRSQRQLMGLASIYFLNMLAHAVMPSVGVLYMGYRYGWDERTVGLVLAVVGLLAMVVQGGLIGPVVSRFGERRALLAGLLFGVAGFWMWGIASTGPLFFIGLPLISLWGFANPAAQGLMTRLVSEREQGQLQGANGSAQGIANLIGPGLFTQVFAVSIVTVGAWHVPGAPFFVAGFLLLAAFVVALRSPQSSG